MNRTLDKDSEFYLDKSLEGAAMRDQMTDFYNRLGYWSSVASSNDAERKTLQACFDKAKDKAKEIRAIKARESGFKSAIQDAFIRNFWDETVVIDGESLTPEEIQNALNKVIERDNESRSNKDVCQYAVDICRSLLSWDKQELSRIGAS
jgi:hypothetical protein